MVVVVGLLLASCGDDADNDAVVDEEPEVGDCPLEALDEAVEADGPVEITYWSAMTDVPAEMTRELTDEFNNSQDRVRVTVVDNNGYTEQQEKYLAGLTTGDMPDLVQHQETFLQKMIDTETALPVEACIEATGHDVSDYVPRMLAYYNVAGVQWALPFNVNTPVFIYDRAILEQAGLDPDQSPETLDELYDAAEAIRDAGFEAGMGLRIDGWHLEQFLAMRGQPLVNNGNGRESRPTEVGFDRDSAVEIFTVLNDLVQDGLARTNPREGANPIGNLLGIGTRDWGMTFDSSGVLGAAWAVLDTGQFEDADPAAAPMPSRTEDGGVLIGGGGLYISADEPAKQAAAWEFLTYLTSPETQSVWAAETGFIPVRESAIELPELQERWEEDPQFRVAYDQLLEGAENEATAGPVIGEYLDVRLTLEDIEAEMFRGAMTPEEAVDLAIEEINDILQTYNERLGV
jgi:sn-glycerol 3-phosphate transport system substrate-binding protein